MKRGSHSARYLSLTVLFLAIAALCSVPRFGQRENEALPVVSDSDAFLDMARVFSGEAEHFRRDWVIDIPLQYRRPLLSFLAAPLGRHLLGGNMRAAISVVQILAATVTALLLLRIVRKQHPDWTFDWLPSVLFLSAFPQMNWGYHLLSDNLGITTALALASYGEWLLSRSTATPAPSWRFWGLHLALLWAVSVLAFLTRETALFAVITLVYLIVARFARAPRRVLLPWGVVLLVVALGKLPHIAYVEHHDIPPWPIFNSLEALLNPRYILDFVVKTGVCFNLAWILAALAVRRPGRSRIPGFVHGWSIAALLYMAAGYYNNYVEGKGGVGYPLRMSFTLFPYVFLRATEFLETLLPAARRMAVVIAYAVVQYAINLLGVSLDPAQGKITITDVLEGVRSLFR
jgi:hypothetical protein